MSVASLFTLFTSIVYNIAIATSDTDLIMNAVIILFICDLDELMYDILIEINPCYAANEEVEEEDEHNGALAARVGQLENSLTTKGVELERRLRNEEERNTLLQNRVQQLEEQVQGCTKGRQTIQEAQEENEGMKKKVQQVEENMQQVEEKLQQVEERHSKEIKEIREEMALRRPA